MILVIDVCPKSASNEKKLTEVFAAEIEGANLLVDAFKSDDPEMSSKANFALITYCGPRTWSGVSKCDGKQPVDQEKVCKIINALHFEESAKKVKDTLNGLTPAPGTKLTAMALLAAQAELTLGRKDAPSVVITFTDGQPLSFRKTRLAAHALRKKARLLFVPVVKFSPLKDIKTWVTRRWQENIVKVEKWEYWKNAS